MCFIVFFVTQPIYISNLPSKLDVVGWAFLLLGHAQSLPAVSISTLQVNAWSPRTGSTVTLLVIAPVSWK